jgi:hypothetical protein
MRTVPSLIKTLYGDDAAAAKAHRVGITAVCNWKAAGKFPARLLAKLLMDAEAKGEALSVRDVPLAKRRATACAA